MKNKLTMILIAPLALSACVVGTTVYDDPYYDPHVYHGYGYPYHYYDYYYYPDVDVYFHLFTG